MPDCDIHLMHRFSAFISYSHLDAVFARKLHRRLEAYRLPRRLSSDRVGARRHLKPIFRDHDELAAAPDLSGAVKAALADSEYLIVICSAHAEASAWVAREVSVFRELHGEHAVLAVLVDGCDDACFRRLLCGDGFDGGGIEPVAADFRRDGDGRSLAFLKLVSVLADVRLAALVQRDAQRRIRRILLAGSSALVGTVALVSLAGIAIDLKIKRDHDNALNKSFIKHQNEELRKKLIAHGRTDILHTLDNGTLEWFRSQDVVRLPPADQEEFAKVLQDVGQDDESSGSLEDATKEYAEAYRVTEALLKQDSTDLKRVFAHAQSEFWVGENALRMGRDDFTEKSFTAYATSAGKLVQADPENLEWLMEKGDSLSDLGTFFMRRKNDLKRAESYYIAALGAYSKVHTLRPRDGDVTRELAELYGWLGDVTRLEGDCKAAATFRDHTRELLTDLEKDDPGNLDVKSALAADELASARIELCEGALQTALQKLKVGYEDAVSLADNDPFNADRRQQVRIIELFEVSTWLSQPQAERPHGDVIARTLGDCHAEAKLRNNDEIAEFCFILQARQAMRLGCSEEAELALKSARLIADSHTDALSRRWGLNFQAEIDEISQIKPDTEKQQ